MKPILPCVACFLLALVFLPSESPAQEGYNYAIVLETQAFANGEIESLSEQLYAAHSFELSAACPDNGLLLVEYPSTLAVRRGQAETMIIQSIEELWQRSAVVNRDISREEVLECNLD